MRGNLFNRIFSRPWTVVVVLVVLAVQVGELLLLERKYNLFGGGFLQSEALLGASERAEFLFLSLWLDLFLFGLLALGWAWAAGKLRWRPLYASYHYLVAAGYASGLVLFAKYKVLSYFSDTINFTIIANLGGGSLATALAYLGDETAVLVWVATALLLLYLIGLRVVNRLSIGLASVALVARRPVRLLPVIGFVLATLLALIWANNDDKLRYALKKKLSYTVVTEILNSLTDFDRDGYGHFSFPPDPEPFNAGIYPGALDIPNNGIDEDGFAGDFVYREPSTGRVLADPPEGATKKHVLIIVLESTRGDLIDKKIDGRYVAPNIMALAAKGKAIHYGYSHSGYTAPSLRALFTGSLARRSRDQSLFAYFRRLGYEISVFSGQDESWDGLKDSTGMEANSAYLFDARSAIEERVFASAAPSSLRLSEERVAKEFVHRLGQANWSVPQFIYVNLQSAHFPYAHPGMPKLLTQSFIPRSEISAANRHWLEVTYWNALASADRTIGEMLSHLKDTGVYEQTVVVVLGDHGESLFDDGFLGHGHALNAVQTRIPLVFSVADLEVQEPVGLMDLAGIIVSAALGSPPARKSGMKAVFQYVGSLHEPVQIGLVEYGERRTILDLRTREVLLSELGHWQLFDVAYANEEHHDRLKELVFQWEAIRWEDSRADR